ncbi:MAG: alginate lyase family protein, partial [Bacteroidia bacterium]|nr:alginate lyase family protein [Bacteroidia bacterium]
MLRTLFILIVSLITYFESGAQEHPNLTLTSEGVETIKNGIGQVPLFQKLLEKDISIVDAEIESGIHVPVPRDMAGGYTHERHKQNFFILQKAGNLYQITGDVRYAEYIKESLLQYAKLYPTLPLHPTNRSYATGKIFWQCLNDANWLLYVSQAYDCIYDYLDEKEREMIENDLFIPFARFLSIDNPKFFNRIHNHSTWANAAVGMIGLVMKNKELIQWSLYGLPEDGIDENEVDNDGGYIKQKGVRIAGFLAQLDHSFSPDGYFSEGPYYLRYAIFPFLVYARALHNNMPELDILNYRDGILAKAVDALLQQTDFNGLFFPLNDAQKGMSWNARELVTAVDLMYAYQEKDPALLDIASKQNKVLIDDAGFIVAKDLSAGLKKEFKHKPIAFGDGKDGDEGGVG